MFKEPHGEFLYLYISRPMYPTKLFGVIRSNDCKSQRYMISPNMSDDLKVKQEKH